VTAADGTAPTGPGGETASERDVAIEALGLHRETSDHVPGRGLRVGCRCGWTGKCYLHGYGDPAAHREWDEHRADELVAALAAERANARRELADAVRALAEEIVGEWRRDPSQAAYVAREIAARLRALVDPT
jgi:hypothetical protein